VNTDDAAPAQNYTSIEIRCYFVRQRNALLVRGQFTDLFVDYYLHLADHGLKLTDLQDGTLKEGLVGLTLHLASRPWNEFHSWNVHFEEPLVNLFVCGDNTTSKIVGRAFGGNRRDDGLNLFLAQVQKKGMAEPRTSTVDFEAKSVFPAVERFYQQSEQRIVRIFEVGEEDFIMISAQPQCDTEWLESLAIEDIRELDRKEELSLLEQRTYHFECGCSARRVCAAIAPHLKEGPDEFFGDQEVLAIQCTRCGVEHRISKEQFEAYLQGREQRQA
jgi:molecular chaperone Hsp33